jgi:hypothetical protein
MAQAEIFSDLHQSLTTDAQGNIRKVVNIDAIITSIDNILRTKPGERPMLRAFGSRLTTLLFENIQEEYFDILADEIKSAIEKWDNRVGISSINFDSKADENSVDIKMTFIVRGFDNIFTYSTQLQGLQ